MKRVKAPRFARRGKRVVETYQRPTLKTREDIAAMREAGRLVADCFAALHDAIAPGVRLDALDAMVEAMIRERGAEPLYKGYQGTPPTHPPFPGVICASVNDEICHGLPDARVLDEGDIVGIDIGLKYRGYCGDSCVTYAVGEIAPEAKRLLDVARTCLQLGIRAAQPGHRLHDIAAAVEHHAVAQGYGVVSLYAGHGIGKSLHEAPSVVHVTGIPGQGMVLQEGMVFTIEPMINQGTADCELLDDGWTVVTADGKLSAQFEHTVAITADGPLVLSVR